jgi:hypothetical protein
VFFTGRAVPTCSLCRHVCTSQTWPSCSQIPTWHVWDLWHPECDTGCYFPVINRPNVVMQFMRAAAQDASLVKGAWMLLAESDYLWMQPVMVRALVRPVMPHHKTASDKEGGLLTIKMQHNLPATSACAGSG